MVYTLWGEPGSGSFMIEAALAEAGQQVQLVDIDLTRDEQRRDEFLAINPSGKVPALRFPDGEMMTESAAILLALAEAHPQATLMPPPGEPDRRMALRALIHIASELYPLIEIADYPTRFAPPETFEVGVRSVVRKRLRERWLVLEREAAGGTSYLLRGFSAIDLAIAIISDWEIGRDWRAKECPKLDTIAKSVATRPALAEVCRRHFKAAAPG